MPVPLSLISILNSAKKEDGVPVAPFTDSFENWPNGTSDAAPEGWTISDSESFATVDAYTSKVTDGTYSMRITSGNFGPYFIMTRVVDLTSASTLKADVSLTRGSSTFGSQVLKVGGTVLIDFADYIGGVGNVVFDEGGDISSFTGETTIEFNLGVDTLNNEEIDVTIDNLRFE